MKIFKKSKRSMEKTEEEILNEISNLSEKLDVDFSMNSQTTLEEFQSRVDALLNYARETREEKNPAYSGDNDYHENFKTAAKFLDVRPITVAAIYYWKHVSAILSYAKDKDIEQAESLESRFVDCLNYSFIMYSLYKEEQEFQNKTD